MRNKKMSRLISVVLSGLMIVGGISLNTYAEDFITDMEIVIEEGTDLVTDVPVYTEEPVIEVEDEIIIEEIIVDTVESEVVQEPVEGVESGLETEGETEGFSVELLGEVDSAEVEDALNNEEVQEEMIPTTITLNYETYTLTEVGETVMLSATVVTGEEEETEAEAGVTFVLAGEAEVIDEAVIAEDTEEVSEEVTAAEEVAVMEEELTVEVVSEVEKTVTWVSSDESVATVDGIGMVTAVSSGEAVITCTLDEDANVTATCVITVTAECALQEHVHSLDCLVRTLICDHVSEEDHTSECFLNDFGCGYVEHVHDDTCFDGAEVPAAEEELAAAETVEVAYVE